MDDGADICRAAKACGERFDTCLADPLLRDFVVFIRSAQGDYNLWCSTIKATSQGKVSLDYRLRNHQDARDRVCELLAALAASLGRWATRATGKFHSMHADLEPQLYAAVDPMREIPDSPTSTDSPASWDAISDEWSNADSKNDNDIAVLDPIIAECISYVKIALDQLARLSLAFQKAANKLRFEDVDAQLDNAAYGPFRTHLTSVILRAFTDPEAENLSVEENMKRIADYEALTPVQRQLVSANVLRRHRIDFVTIPGGKGERPAIEDTGLVKDSRRLDETQTFRAPSAPGFQTSRQTLDTLSLRPAKAELPQSVQTTSAAPESVPTATDNSSQIEVNRVLKAPTSSNITKVTKIAIAQPYPDCPKPSSDGLLICPYCNDLLPSSYAEEGQSWRAHVAQDLMPYSCFIDGCKTPYEMYLTSENLLDHVMDKHSTDCWTCNFCRPGYYNDKNPLHCTTLDFWSAEDWVNHVTMVHSDRARVANLSVLTDLSRRSVLGPLPCPLCDFSTRNLGSRIDDHILQHLHEFSLRALPAIFNTNTNDRSNASHLSDSVSYVREVKPEGPRHPAESPVIDPAQWLSNLEKVRSFYRSPSLDSIYHITGQLENNALNSWATEFWGIQMLKLSNVLETIFSTAELSSMDMTKDMIEDMIQQTSADILNALDLHGSNLYHENVETATAWVFAVPGPLGSPMFTSQKSIKDVVDNHLFQQISNFHLGSNSQPQQQPRVLLTGNSGIGKTLIAGELARQIVGQRTNYSVFWVNATSFDSVSHAYSGILKLLKKPNDGRYPERSLVYHLNWLLRGQWLMVLDGIDGHTLQRMRFEGWLPSGVGGRLLLTSQDASCVHILDQVTEIRLPPRGQMLPFHTKPSLAPSRPVDFDVAIICQSLAEYGAILALFDETWEEDPRFFGRSGNSVSGTSAQNSGKYRGGQICGCNAVLALEPDSTSEVVVTEIQRNFKGIQLALFVGNCSGLPTESSAQIVRGDVLLGNGAVTFWSDSMDTTKLPLSAYTRPLLDAMNEDYGRETLRKDAAFFLRVLQAPTHKHDGYKSGVYVYPGVVEDKLFESSYPHKHRDTSKCACNDNATSSAAVCNDALQSSCNTLGCENQHLVARDWPHVQEAQYSNTRSHDPSLHYGELSCLDRMPQGMDERRRIRRTISTYQEKREAAPGLMVGWSKVLRSYPCMTVHGVRDYGDDHNSSMWTEYAAATAASAAKAILGLYNRMAPCMIPFRIEADQSDRGMFLSELRDNLINGTFDGQKAMILGPLNSGKTYLAFQAVNIFRKWNPDCSVFCVSALTTKILDEGFRGVGRRLRANRFSECDLQPGENSTSRVLLTLDRPDAGDWVLIIDDVNLGIPDVLADWLRASPRGFVFLVSQERGLPQWLQIPDTNVITVPPIEPKHTIVHELAVNDQTYEELKQKWPVSEDELQITLRMVADQRGEKYSMKNSFWMELDVWNYTYEPLENRQKAIQNATRHYDDERLEPLHEARMRLLEWKERLSNRHGREPRSTPNIPQRLVPLRRIASSDALKAKRVQTTHSVADQKKLANFSRLLSSADNQVELFGKEMPAMSFSLSRVTEGTSTPKDYICIRGLNNREDITIFHTAMSKNRYRSFYHPLKLCYEAEDKNKPL